MTDFQQFDRNLEDLRSAVADASNTMHQAISRYVAMMSAIETAFVLYYDDLPAADRLAMTAAFNKLRSAVPRQEKAPTNIHPLK